MKQIINTILIIIISYPLFAGTENYEQKFKEANNLFSQNKFEDALILFQEIINEDYASADLFYNTANTYYRLNSIGESIYYYEKAIQLSPDNEDYMYNLELTNLRVKNKPEILPKTALVSFIEDIIYIGSATFWAFIGISLFVLFLLVFFLYIKSQTSRRKKIYFLTSMIILFVSLSAMFFMQYQTSILNSDTEAIIITEETEARSSPDETASVLFSVYEGFKIEVEDKSGVWCEIKLTDGKKAWIKEEHIKRL